MRKASSVAGSSMANTTLPSSLSRVIAPPLAKIMSRIKPGEAPLVDDAVAVGVAGGSLGDALKRLPGPLAVLVQLNGIA